MYFEEEKGKIQKLIYYRTLMFIVGTGIYCKLKSSQGGNTRMAQPFAVFGIFYTIQKSSDFFFEIGSGDLWIKL